MKTIYRILQFLIVIVLPFFLVITSIRVLFTPVFIELEYRRADFPADTYGFTIEDRLYWSRISIDYLLNSEGISFLAEKRLADGNPLYNDRELSHMVDVKVLLQNTLTAWYFMIFLLAASGFWSWRSGWQPDFWKAVRNGGWLTVGIIAAVLVGVAVSFRALFTGFHEIFFTGESWIFLYTDTLIRLFPLQFWQDGFIAMGGLTILGAVIAIVLGNRQSR